MSGATAAADHMRLALTALFTGSTSPFLHWYPSGGLVLATGEPDPFGNFAAGLEADEWDVAATKLARPEAPAMLVWPSPRDPAMEARWEPEGFVHAVEVPAMSVALDALPETPLPPGHTFERVTSTSDGPSWADVLVEGYPVAPMAAQAMSPVHTPLDHGDDAAVQFFQVRAGGETAGVSALVLAGGLAGIYCVATRPTHRRKGIGAALTAMPLGLARDLGYTTGVLQASPAGYPVYQRLGFVDDGTVHLYMRAMALESPTN